MLLSIGTYTDRLDWPSGMMQNAINTGFFVIPARAGIQNSLFFLVRESWTPAFSGVTNRFASSC